eukprot:1080463-Pelagomonas_calceolata.AAC.1
MPASSALLIVLVGPRPLGSMYSCSCGEGGTSRGRDFFLTNRNFFLHLFDVRRWLELTFLGVQDEKEVAIGLQGCCAQGVETSTHWHFVGPPLPVGSRQQ